MHVKRKIPSFVFGVSIGLLIGIGFFMFKLDTYFNRMKSVVSQQINVVEHPVKSDKQESNANTNRFKISTKSTVDVNYKEVDSLIQPDPEINVAKDELLFVKNMKLIDLDNSVKDTVSAKLAGVSTDENTGLFFVEFWKTPLNSVGYRMSKNRLLLYGFSDFSNFNIYKVDDVYYLKNDRQVYKLTAGTEFMSMEKVNDTGLLARIN
jgi:hypothetical protein